MNGKITRDEVLDAFGAAAAWPTEELLREWVKRYPKFERDLVEFATLWAATANLPEEEMDSQLEDSIVNRVMSRVQTLDRELEDELPAALPAAYASAAAARAALCVSDAVCLHIDSLEQALRARGVSGEWANTLQIDDSIFVLMEEHMISPPVPQRLLDTFSKVLGVQVEAFRAWLFQVPAPQYAWYATKTPTIERWSFQMAVEKSSLPEPLKKQWLAESVDS